jgi:pimeloyl-ACP methyl ester carboxylesterase/DNA-binding winged helix-turn-helix (wHTH) protein
VATRYRFDGFELDTELVELRKGDERIPLEPQVFDVLAYLVANHHRLVPKDELLEHIWPEKYISEASLTTRLMAARKALGDNGRDQRFIRTVHRRGYRFVGAVDTETQRDVPEESAGAQPAQTIRFCTAVDGTRIAYATSGSGPPLVKAANWLTHLDYDTTSPVWRHLWDGFARNFSLVRYDARGSGLSDWDVDRFSFEAWVDDLEAVVDELGLDRFPLLGLSQGGAVAIAYAARHPERVSHLVLLGAFGRGRLARASTLWADRHAAMRTLMLQSWGREDAAFREIFSITMIPDGTPEQLRWLTDLQRVSANPTNAVRFHDTSGDIDVDALLPMIQAPTLVLHARGDQRVPFEEGRRLATLIPRASFVALESRNHLLLEDEPAWARCHAEIVMFLQSDLTKASDR